MLLWFPRLLLRSLLVAELHKWKKQKESPPALLWLQPGANSSDIMRSYTKPEAVYRSVPSGRGAELPSIRFLRGQLILLKKSKISVQRPINYGFSSIDGRISVPFQSKSDHFLQSCPYPLTTTGHYYSSLTANFGWIREVLLRPGLFQTFTHICGFKILSSVDFPSPPLPGQLEVSFFKECWDNNTLGQVTAMK